MSKYEYLNDLELLFEDFEKVRESFNSVSDINTDKVSQSLIILEKSFSDVLDNLQSDEDVNDFENNLADNLNLLSERLEAITIQLENK